MNLKIMGMMGGVRESQVPNTESFIPEEYCQSPLGLVLVQIICSLFVILVNILIKLAVPKLTPVNYNDSRSKHYEPCSSVNVT